jgi:GNAT superfamily N-acetyltransferase
MTDKFATGTAEHLTYVLAWLKQEHETTGEGFYCNASVIQECFAEGKAVCALRDEAVVAFAVFFVVPPTSGVSIIEVHPSYREQGVGRRLMTEVLKRLRRRGAEYVNADCTSKAGEALCLSTGFEPREDRYAHRGAQVIAQLQYRFVPQRPRQESRALGAA